MEYAARLYITVSITKVYAHTEVQVFESGKFPRMRISGEWAALTEFCVGVQSQFQGPKLNCGPKTQTRPP